MCVCQTDMGLDRTETHMCDIDIDIHNYTTTQEYIQLYNYTTINTYTVIHNYIYNYIIIYTYAYIHTPYINPLNP